MIVGSFSWANNFFVSRQCFLRLPTIFQLETFLYLRTEKLITLKPKFLNILLQLSILQAFTCGWEVIAAENHNSNLLPFLNPAIEGDSVIWNFSDCIQQFDAYQRSIDTLNDNEGLFVREEHATRYQVHEKGDTLLLTSISNHNTKLVFEQPAAFSVRSLTLRGNSLQQPFKADFEFDHKRPCVLVGTQNVRYMSDGVLQMPDYRCRVRLMHVQTRVKLPATLHADSLLLNSYIFLHDSISTPILESYMATNGNGDALFACSIRATLSESEIQRIHLPENDKGKGKQQDQASVKIYPNPCTEVLYADLNSLAPVSCDIFLYSMDGTIVSQSHHQVGNGSSLLNINTTSLSPARYLLSVHSTDNDGNTYLWSTIIIKQ